MKSIQLKTILKNRYLLFVSLIFFVGGVTHAHSGSDKKHQVVLTGAYRCPGDFVGSGLQHSIIFTASDLGELHIETIHGNLDTGDCAPRGEDARTLAKTLGCTVGPATIFQPGAGSQGRAFGFVCQSDHNTIVNTIGALSREILRPTQ